MLIRWSWPYAEKVPLRPRGQRSGQASRTLPPSFMLRAASLLKVLLSGSPVVTLFTPPGLSTSRWPGGHCAACRRKTIHSPGSWTARKPARRPSAHAASRLATAWQRRPALRQRSGEGDERCPERGRRPGREAPEEERGQRDGSGARAARLGSGRKRGRRSTPGTARPGLPHAPVTRHPPAAHVRSPCPPRPSEGHGEALRARTRAPYAHPAPALPTELGAGAAAGSRPRRSFPDAPMVATLARRYFHRVFTCTSISRTSLRLSQRRLAFTQLDG